jgi:hypothetical protein
MYERKELGDSEENYAESGGWRRKKGGFAGVIGQKTFAPSSKAGEGEGGEKRIGLRLSVHYETIKALGERSSLGISISDPGIGCSGGGL